MALPSVVSFEGLTTPENPRLFSYVRLGFRPPRKGEYYLSGARVRAWLAPNDLSTAYMVVKPLPFPASVSTL